MNIVGKIVETDRELEAMRIIRNGGREWMTEDKSEVTLEQQAAWWTLKKEVSPKDFVAVVYTSRVLGGFAGVPGVGVSGAFYQHVGYGILSRRDDGKLYISLAVHPRARGFGIGTFIYSDMAKRTSEDVHAVVLKSNVASARAASRAGYYLFEENGDRMLFMKRYCTACKGSGVVFVGDSDRHYICPTCEEESMRAAGMMDESAREEK